MNCKNCGSLLEQGTTVCQNCGELAYPNQLNSDNMNMNPTIGSQNQTEPSNPKKKLSIFLIVFGIVFIAIGTLLSTFSLSGKQVIEKEVTSLFSSMKQIIKENENQTLDYDLEKEAIGITGILTISSDYKDSMIDLTKLNDYELNYQGIIDKKNNEFSSKINLSKNKDSLFAIDEYLNAKNLYLSLGDVYERIITTQIPKELKDFDFSKNNSIEDAQKLLEKTEKLVKSFIDEKDIQKTKIEKEINGKKENLAKISYKIKVHELKKHLWKGYLEDKESIQLLSKWTSMSESELKEYFEQNIKFIEEYADYYNDTREINVYIKGINTLREIEITSGETAFIIDKEGSIYQYRYEQNGIKLFSGEYDSKNKKVTLTNSAITLTVQQQKESILIDINYSVSEEKMNIHIESKNKTSNSIYENDATIDIEYGEMKLSAKNQLKLEKNQKIERINSNNIVDMQNITPEETAEIYARIYGKFEAIINDIAPNYMEYLNAVNDTVLYRKNKN